jgi:molecular chaperone GrpE (heat shock protein)
VERYHPEDGHDFNPSHHEVFVLSLLSSQLMLTRIKALYVVPAESKEKANKVAGVLKKGYSLRGRVLR